MREVYALDDVQQIVDKVCEVVVSIAPYRLALLSLYFGEDVYIGLAGGDDAMRRSFLEEARQADHERRAAKRKAIWREYRIPETSICFIPEGSAIGFSTSFQPSEAREKDGWRPEDRLMVFVRGADREVRGVLSLDDPASGERPDPANLGALGAVDRLIELMGVVIHNKHLSAKLRESEERYAAVVEQGHDGIFVERDGRILFANGRVARMLASEPATLLDTDLATVLERSDTAAVTGEEEGRLLRPDGRTIDVAIRSSTIRLGGANAQVVAVADITERKRIFTQLMRAQKMEGVGTLASGIAHDFNNLLGGILGYASLLRMRLGADENLRRYVDSIEKAADRASAVTRQLLGIVRDERVRVAPFDVRRLLEDVTRLFRETIDPSIAILLECPEDLPAILGDETQIHQVVLNICINARDAMPGGGTLSITADRVNVPNRGPGVRIRVKDTGIGMSKEVMAKVFDPFFTTKQAGEGTGLGLYMAYRVIERHGGFVDVTSKPGRGTTVEFHLPAQEARAPLPTARAVPPGCRRARSPPRSRRCRSPARSAARHIRG
ncbi:MAG: PAS domain S-box protein [Planctomycetes bacterium]|nr:PAS domain S-box protein [Planctomycetota bacterium]